MKRHLRSVAGVVAVAFGLAVFLLWQEVVGNPHVIETIIGVILAVIVGLWVYALLRRMARRV